MGQPAARLGDPTTHGGSIVMGFPMVLIGGQPAARISDMHVCPMVSPGPVPHVGGPISLGSFTVLIGSLPAARQGDMAVCVGPPDSIAMGCPTVLIGDGGSVGAGFGMGGEGKIKAPGSLVTALTDIGEAITGAGGVEDKKDFHYLWVSFVDKGGFPISGLKYKLSNPDYGVSDGMLAGDVRASGIKPGNYKIELKAIINAKWSTKIAKVGEKVKMIAETAGIDSGEKAVLELKIRDSNYSHRVLKLIETEVKDNKIEEEWALIVDDEFLKIQEEKLKLGRYSSPTYYFEARAAGCSLRSGLLECKDEIEIKLKDDAGNAIPNKKYKLFLPSGEVREGTLDSSGYAKETQVPPGYVKVSFNVRKGSWT